MRRFTYLYLLCLLVFFSCGDDDANLSNKLVFRYNQASNISSLDPAFAKDQANMWAVNQLFNGLVQTNNQLQIQPCIAKSWKISNDGLTYTFILRNDVFFHNDPLFDHGKGERLTAKDVAYSLGRIVDKSVASTGAWLFNDHIAAQNPFKAINDTTFVLQLQHPFPPMLSILSMQYCSIVPQKIAEHYGKDFSRHPIGTGAFTFKVWKENEVLILTKNENYFEQNAQNQQLPFIDGIKVTFMDNKRNEFLKFKDGELDMLSGIDATYKDELLTPNGKLKPEWEATTTLLRSPYLNTEYLGFMMNDSLQKNEALKKRDVRRAINYAIDRQKIITYLHNGIGTPATSGFVPPALPSFDSLRVRGYHYDPKKAAKLLAKAGYPDGKNFPPLSLETNETYKDIAIMVQKSLSEIGIPVQIQLNPPALLREKMSKGEVSFFRASWIGDYPDAETYLTVLYGNNPAPPNYTRFSNYQYDCIYRQAMQQADTTKRYDEYKRADNLLMEEAPIVPLYYDEVLRFTNKRVSDLGINGFNLLSLKNVRLSNK